MGLEHVIIIPIGLFLALFGVYLCGRMFGLGFKASLKQTKETKHGTRQ